VILALHALALLDSLPHSLPTSLSSPEQMTDFSIFENDHEIYSSGSIPHEVFIKGIREGAWDNEVQQCRRILKKHGIKTYKKARGSVTCVTLSAFLKHRRGGTSLKQRGAVHTGYIQVDIDPGHNPGMDLEKARGIVDAYPSTKSCFLSLSGKGIKAIVRIPPSFETHLGSWLSIEKHFKQQGLTIDPNTSDECRLCYVSSDPNAFSREEAVEVVPLDLPEISDKDYGSLSNGSVRPDWAREVLARVAERLDTPPSRADWLKASSATFEGVGIDAGIELLEEVWPEMERGEYRQLARTLPKFIPWGTLRSFGVNPDDPEDLLAGLPGEDDEASELPDVASPPDPDGFPIIRASDLDGASEALDFVEGILTEGGASVVYGPSNCGKTFEVLDLGSSVATGQPFRGIHEVKQGAVIYVALEGSHGARNRIEALKRSGKLPNDAPLFLCFAAVSLLDKKDTAKLIASIGRAAAESDHPCLLVILDTFARALAGGDENSGKDVGAAVKAMDAIRAATSAHVMLVHHCGKNEALGARGHSSLRAAVDTEIEISRSEGEKISTMRITKQRDLPIGDPMPFSLEVVTLGTDRRGKPITSCVVRHEDVAMASKPGKAGRKAKCTGEEMLRYLPAANVTEWKNRVHEECGLGPSQFYTNKKELERRGKIRREDGSNRIFRTDPCDFLPDVDE
jgi:hypothetical protein